MEQNKIQIHFVVNDQPVTVSVDPRLRLLDVLREELHLIGTKEGCGKGECGACTVIMDGKAVDACLLMSYQAEDAHVTTIEGLCQNDTLHPLQQAFMDCGSVQCGICIPGMIVAGKALLDENPAPTLDQIKYGLAGNLCRCTGYVKIFEAVRQTALELCASLPSPATPRASGNGNQELTAPEAPISLFRPTRLADALKRIAEQGDGLKCISGGTDILVQAKDGMISTRNLMDISAIPELRGIREENGSIWIGSATPFDEIVKCTVIQRYAPALVQGCALIGGPQIRNRGTIGGNLGNASPAADSVPPLYTLETQVEIQSLNGERVIPVQHFFRGPRKSVLARGEIIRGVRFAKREGTKGVFLRLGQRQAQAISKVSLATTAGVKAHGKFEYLKIALGAVAPTVICADKTEAILLNDGLNKKSLTRAREMIKQEAQPIDDLRSMREYRREMCAVLLERALTAVTRE